MIRMMPMIAAVLLAGLLAAPARAQSPATLRPYALAIGVGSKTATAVAGAATLHQPSGIITSEALVTAAGASYTLTLTDNTISGSEIVVASVSDGTSTTGQPAVATVTATANTLKIVVQNIAAAAALNGTIKIAFLTVEP